MDDDLHEKSRGLTGDKVPLIWRGSSLFSLRPGTPGFVIRDRERALQIWRQFTTACPQFLASDEALLSKGFQTLKARDSPDLAMEWLIK